MARRLTTLVGTLLLGTVAILVVLFVGMRSKSPLVLDTVRRVNRAVFNPRQMQTAGTPGAYASIIRHRGRTSGRDYETPIGAVAIDDGFVVALPYGPNTDWVKNLLASGSATIVHEGDTYQVDQPEIIPMDGALTYFSPSDQRAHRLFGIDHCLRVRRADPLPGA